MLNKTVLGLHNTEIAGCANICTGKFEQKIFMQRHIITKRPEYQYLLNPLNIGRKDQIYHYYNLMNIDPDAKCINVYDTFEEAKENQFLNVGIQ